MDQFMGFPSGHSLALPRRRQALLRQRFWLAIALAFGASVAAAPIWSCRSFGADVVLETDGGRSYPMYDASKALLIGSSVYHKSQLFGPLPSIEADLANLSAELRREGFDVGVLLNPSGDEIRRALNKIVLGASYGSRLFIYFAGHGWSDPETDPPSGYIVPSNSPSPDERSKFGSVALSMAEFNAIIQKTHAKHVFVAFDSCFSGSVFATRGEDDNRRHLNTLFLEEANQPQRYYLTAGNEHDEVPADDRFTGYLIEGLEGAADLVRDGVITSEELGIYVKDRIIKAIPQGGVPVTPLHGPMDNPGRYRGQVLFPILGRSVVVPSNRGRSASEIRPGGAPKAFVSPWTVWLKDPRDNDLWFEFNRQDGTERFVFRELTSISGNVMLSREKFPAYLWLPVQGDAWIFDPGGMRMWERLIELLPSNMDPTTDMVRQMLKVAP